MLFADDKAVDELAKASTILQCIVAQLDFECAKHHVQPTLQGVNNSHAYIDCDPLRPDQLREVCLRVSNLYKRIDGGYTCYPNDNKGTFVICRSAKLEEYSQLT